MIKSYSGYIVAFIMLLLFLFSKCENTKLKKEIAVTTAKLHSSDTTFVYDTTVLTSVDSIYFTINKPVVVEYRDTISTFITKNEIIYKDTLRLVNLYKDSLVNKDGVFFSKVLTDGVLYGNSITYKLSDTITTYNKFITRVDSIESFKTNLFQGYVGGAVGLNDISNPFQSDYTARIGASIIFKEKTMWIYDYDVINKMHAVGVKVRIF